MPVVNCKSCGHYCKFAFEEQPQMNRFGRGHCCACGAQVTGKSPPGSTATGGSTMSKKYVVLSGDQIQVVNGAYSVDDEKAARDFAEALARQGKTVVLYEAKATVKTSHPPVAWSDQGAAGSAPKA